jgi:hypothetical protein
MAVAFGGNHGHPVHRESRGEKRLREHEELYRSQMTKRSIGTKKLLLLCLRTFWYPIADRQVNQNGEGDRAGCTMALALRPLSSRSTDARGHTCSGEVRGPPAMWPRTEWTGPARYIDREQACGLQAPASRGICTPTICSERYALCKDHFYYQISDNACSRCRRKVTRRLLSPDKVIMDDLRTP